MRVDPRTVRIHFERERQRVAVLGRARVPANGPLAPASPGIAPASTGPAGEQRAFYFYELRPAPRVSGQAHHELTIAAWIAAEKQYAPTLLAWAQRRLSSERYRLKQRARAAALRRKREQRLESCEQRCATVTRQLGALVRKLDGLRFADTRTIQTVCNEVRSIATLCAGGPVSR